MKRPHVNAGLSALAALVALSAGARPSAPEVQVYKSPNCSCCGAWAEHLRAAGFAVRLTEVADAAATRSRLGMSDRFASCHTATVGGYVLEGHVPATEIKQLLAGRPKALGLAVPGMPLSAPGMSAPGDHHGYDVLLVGAGGRSTVYAAQGKPGRR